MVIGPGYVFVALNKYYILNDFCEEFLKWQLNYLVNYTNMLCLLC